MGNLFTIPMLHEIKARNSKPNLSFLCTGCYEANLVSSGLIVNGVCSCTRQFQVNDKNVNIEPRSNTGHSLQINICHC